jgi:hypothetical protein
MSGLNGGVEETNLAALMIALRLAKDCSLKATPNSCYRSPWQEVAKN